MNIKNLLSFLILFFAFSSAFSQAPNLQSLSGFSMFTAAGAMTNTGASVIIGDIGSDAGAITGYGSSTMTGSIHTAGALTAQGNLDVQAAYLTMSSNTCDSTLSGTIGLGNNQVLKPYNYCIGSATLLTDTLILNGMGNSASLFVFKINGVLNTSLGSRVILTNGAMPENVYFQVNGAINTGVNSILVGVLLADGVITLAKGTTLVGRAYSIAGAIHLDSNTITPANFTPLPIALADFSVSKSGGNVCLKWSAATYQHHFIVERSSSALADSWTTIGTIAGSPNTIQYSMTDFNISSGVNYYRLRCFNTSGTETLSDVKIVYGDALTTTKFLVFPNPMHNNFTVTGATPGSIIMLSDMTGKLIMSQAAGDIRKDIISTKDLNGGMYLLKIISAEQQEVSLKLIKF